MAAAVVCAMPSTALAATNLESESMSVASGVVTVTSDAAASGGQAMTLWGNSVITKSITTSEAGDRVVVRARGQQCEGAPSMQVQVDGKVVLTAGVSTTSFADLSAAVSVPAGSHTIRIAFTNDFQRVGSCDRNLIVDRVSIQGAATVKQAETMSLAQGAPHGAVVDDSATSSGKALLMRSNNSASSTVATPAVSTISVRARGTQCNAAPQMTLKINGKTVLSSTVPATSYSDYRVPAALAQGTHRIEVAFTNDFSSTLCDRNLYVDAVTFTGGMTTPTPTPTPTPDPGSGELPQSGYWSSTFAGTGQEPTEWTTWGPASAYGAWGQGQSNELDTPSSFGVPAPPSKAGRVARLYHAASDPAIHHKLYKSFRANTWPSGQGTLTNASPANVSGRYISEFYIDGTRMQNSCGGQLSQFKEEYLTGSAYHNDAAWWFDYDCWMDNKNDVRMRFSGVGQSNAAEWPAGQYLNKWITVELRVYQWDRIEVYVDGVKKATVRGGSRQAVGRTYFPPGSPQLSNAGTMSYDPFNGGGNVTQPVGYIYGAGNYSGKESLVYLGRSMLLPLP